jgi:hypothetical protein
MTANTDALMALARKAAATPGFRAPAPELLAQLIDSDGNHVCHTMSMINDGRDWSTTWMVQCKSAFPREIAIDISGPDWLRYVKQSEVEL